MKLELNARQQKAVRQGRSVKVRDRETARTFVVLPLEEYERLQALQKKEPSRRPLTVEEITARIPPGIRKSQEAYWRDLPKLLPLKSPTRQWVAYHGDERVGFAKTSEALYQRCLRRGLKRGEFYVARLRPRAQPPWEPEVVESSYLLGTVLVDSPTPSA